MKSQWLSILMLGVSVLACGEENSSSAAAIDLMETDSGSDAQVVDAMPAPEQVTITATMRVINPATGRGSSGVAVSAGESDAMTDGTGRGTVIIDSGPYEIALRKAGTRTHTVFGVAGTDPFEQITYMSPEMITSFVFGSLGLNDDGERVSSLLVSTSRGLAPAIGASATIDANSDDPFVFAGNQPTFATRFQIMARDSSLSPMLSQAQSISVSNIQVANADLSR